MSDQIEIKLFATLGRFIPSSADCYEIPSGTTVKGLLEKLKIPEEKAKLIFINGVRAGIESPLKNGDRIGIFPPVGGG